MVSTERFDSTAQSANEGGATDSRFTSARVTRRLFLATSALGVGALALAACGTAPAAAPASSPSTAPSSAAPASASAAASAAPAASASSGAARASASGAAATAGGVKLPTFTPIQGPTPDLPGSPDGNIDPAFKVYPQKLFTSVKSTPGDGSDISIMSWSFGAPPTPLSDNPAWQAVNKAVGANLKVTMVAFADYYTAKLPTLIAGGALPDLLSIINDNTIVLVPEFFEKECVDLTPYLSGDAIKDYPNLAAIPTRPWKGTVFNGKIWGVPQPLRPFFWWFWVHQEILDQKGLAQPKDAADYKKQLQALTDAKQSVWGTGVEGGPQYAFGLVNGLYTSIFKAPNNWAVDSSGKFTASLETDQFKAAVAYVRDLYSAGVFDPDGPGWNTLSARDAFAARKIIYRFDGLDANYWQTGPALTPPAKVRVALPFSNDGSKPAYYLGRPNFGFMVIKKETPEARVKMLLRVLDYLAAPFGSEEYGLLHYGIKGTDFNFDDKGNPVTTKKGTSDLIPWNTVTGPAPILYSPLSSDMPGILQEAEKKLFEAGVDDPSIGLYSRTWATKNVVLTRNFGDGLNAIITGQQPLSNFDKLVADWRSGGGDQVKKEFQDAFNAAAH